jgi:putative endonuclease
MSRAAGADAERRAAEFLSRRKFKILESNYCCRGGEIDLVCDDRGTLVFVEVRARRGRRYGTPEETIGAIKRARIILAAQHYLVARGVENRACRFDVVAIEGEEITYYKNAFEA